MGNWNRSAPPWCGLLPKGCGGRCGPGHRRNLAGSPTWGPPQGGVDKHPKARERGEDEVTEGGRGDREV